MLEIRDPGIKLFGKTISVTGDGEDSNETSNCSDNLPVEKDLVEDDSIETDVDHQSDEPSPPSKDELGDQSPHSESDENQKGTITEKEDTESPKEEKDSNESKNCQQKLAIKKPDKILPCPRCNSMDTKFCYYNNYNVNQPRHFCKSCQRYWTAGGTMRNVPVGAGRRKNKSSTSRYCHITVSEALQAARIDIANGSHPGLKTNGTVLTFGSDNPLCESMASALNLAEKKGLTVNGKNGFHPNATTIAPGSMDNGVKNVGSQEPNKQNLNGFTNQMPCFQWPYMWNPAAVPVPAAAFCPPPPGYPMSFYPAPYWNGAIPWNVPWVPPCSPTSQGQKSPVSNPNSPLGKHSRDGEMLKPRENGKSSGTNTTVLVPKTLRIDDPDEAAKSSIWTTLGIKKDKGDPHIKGGFFNSLKISKGEEKAQEIDTSQSLKANPAALCRSINFQESASR